MTIIVTKQINIILFFIIILFVKIYRSHIFGTPPGSLPALNCDDFRFTAFGN
ncbi:hypothetical protein HMPREF0766_11203 [Sphingobacterium spiritivorum ATCC 33861]|uniref:Uncharacterized protein n=1 Tax=Sphingobacterium spiritivorum ATCC 33861 TaxID=525373 RepID=D7VJN4_SPHSI|nr:hypothetical protein HMPREF0766_11203 [Sphingobacterium spiritivorum ATCC 33861]